MEDPHRHLRVVSRFVQHPEHRDAFHVKVKVESTKVLPPQLAIDEEIEGWEELEKGNNNGAGFDSLVRHRKEKMIEEHLKTLNLSAHDRKEWRRRRIARKNMLKEIERPIAFAFYWNTEHDDDIIAVRSPLANPSSSSLSLSSSISSALASLVATDALNLKEGGQRTGSKSGVMTSTCRRKGGNTDNGDTSLSSVNVGDDLACDSPFMLQLDSVALNQSFLFSALVHGLTNQRAPSSTSLPSLSSSSSIPTTTTTTLPSPARFPRAPSSRSILHFLANIASPVAGKVKIPYINTIGAHKYAVKVPLNHTSFAGVYVKDGSSWDVKAAYRRLLIEEYQELYKEHHALAVERKKKAQKLKRLDKERKKASKQLDFDDPDSASPYDILPGDFPALFPQLPNRLSQELGEAIVNPTDDASSTSPPNFPPLSSSSSTLKKTRGQRIFLFQTLVQMPFEYEFTLVPITKSSSSASSSPSSSSSPPSSLSSASPSSLPPYPSTNSAPTLLSNYLFKYSDRLANYSETQFNHQLEKAFPSLTSHQQSTSSSLSVQHRQFLQTTLSSLVGGIGYWHGKSTLQRRRTPEEVAQVKAKHDQAVRVAKERRTRPPPSLDDNQLLYTSINSPEQSLLSCSPSRTCFPRGFLWDEGFHLLLLSSFDPQLAQTILRYWAGLISENGWLPREQILGPESASRVPDEFRPQRNDVANPPTLYLALRELLDRAISKQQQQQQQQRTPDTPHQHDDLSSFAQFLTATLPSFSRQMKWLLRTQAAGPLSDLSLKYKDHPIIQGPTTTSSSKRNADGSIDEKITVDASIRSEVSEWDWTKAKSFSWRFRKLNHCLDSGLDDYPRVPLPPNPLSASDVFSQHKASSDISSLQSAREELLTQTKYIRGEGHVDLHAWLAIATETMAGLCDWLVNYASTSSASSSSPTPFVANTTVVSALKDDALFFHERAHVLNKTLHELHYDSTKKRYGDFAILTQQAVNSTSPLSTYSLYRCSAICYHVLVPLTSHNISPYLSVSFYYYFYYVGGDRNDPRVRLLKTGRQFIHHDGYVALMPFLLKRIPVYSTSPSNTAATSTSNSDDDVNPMLISSLELLTSQAMQSPAGLRSLASSDPLYGM